MLFVDDQGLSWAGAIGLYLFLSVPPLMVAVTWVSGALRLGLLAVALGLLAVAAVQ